MVDCPSIHLIQMLWWATLVPSFFLCLPPQHNLGVRGGIRVRKWRERERGREVVTKVREGGGGEVKSGL